MTNPSSWSTPATIRAKVRRAWDSGSLLRSYATGEPCPLFDLPLRGPGPADLGSALAEAQAWAAALEAGSGYTLVYGTIGGRDVGRTRVPRRAQIDTYSQVWALLGVEPEVRQFVVLLDSTLDPLVRRWALAHPLRALGLRREWPAVESAIEWLQTWRGSGRYLREIDAVGVDTKFIETHLGVLSGILGLPAKKRDFEAALGLASKPLMARLRYRTGDFGLTGSESVLRLDELAALDLRPLRVLIVENEITYLSVPIPPLSVVLWGKGLDVAQLASLPWLAATDVLYWGDLDTHGFLILHRLCTHLPAARSVLMDKETLLAHRDRWGSEPKQFTGALDGLSDCEHQVYQGLVDGRFGVAVRLEQERISWDWALTALAADGWLTDRGI